MGICRDRRRKVRQRGRVFVGGTPIFFLLIGASSSLVIREGLKRPSLSFWSDVLSVRVSLFSSSPLSTVCSLFGLVWYDEGMIIASIVLWIVVVTFVIFTISAVCVVVADAVRLRRVRRQPVVSYEFLAPGGSLRLRVRPRVGADHLVAFPEPFTREHEKLVSDALVGGASVVWGRFVDAVVAVGEAEGVVRAARVLCDDGLVGKGVLVRAEVAFNDAVGVVDTVERALVESVASVVFPESARLDVGDLFDELG